MLGSDRPGVPVNFLIGGGNGLIGLGASDFDQLSRFELGVDEEVVEDSGCSEGQGVARSRAEVLQTFAFLGGDNMETSDFK